MPDAARHCTRGRHRGAATGARNGRTLSGSPGAGGPGRVVCERAVVHGEEGHQAQAPRQPHVARHPVGQDQGPRRGRGDARVGGEGEGRVGWRRRSTRRVEKGQRASGWREQNHRTCCGAQRRRAMSSGSVSALLCIVLRLVVIAMLCIVLRLVVIARRLPAVSL
eukprot:365353-Chlamydomonas_euryale.AAC.1